MSPNALVTLAIGASFDQVARITRPLLLAYAQLHGLSFVNIDKNYVDGIPTFQKVGCYELLKRFERLIYVDSDVLIAPDAPNLLDYVPTEKFGAFLISEHTSFFDSSIALIQQELRDIGWRKEAFNAGVMVASRCHRSLFDPRDPDLEAWLRICAVQPRKKEPFGDQTYFNFKVRDLRIPIHDIGYKFNHTLAPTNSESRFGSHFIHCKGHRKGPKVLEVRRAALVLQSPMLRYAFKRFPSLVKLYDRI